MGIISDEQKQNWQAELTKAVADLDVVKWHKQQAILAETYQKIMDVTGIPASLLKPVTIVTHEADAAPDLEISIGDLSRSASYHRTKPINAIATSPLSRAIDATRTQFEAPSLRYVNKSHEINNDSDEE